MLDGACLAVERGWAKYPNVRREVSRVSSNLDLRTRTYELRLAPAWKGTLAARLLWRESILRRIGRDFTVALWAGAFRTPDDGRMAAILETGWEAGNDEGGGTGRLDEAIDRLFASPLEGVSKAPADEPATMDTGVRQPIKRHHSLDVKRQITRYDPLHLRLDGVARPAGAMTSHRGREGEPVAHDLCPNRSITSAAARGRNRPAAEVLKEWADLARATEATTFSAGLRVELVKESDTEVVLHVTACERARSFGERQPSVGSLVAWSTDEAGLRATTDALSLQRSSTNMEGGACCGFRFYKD